MSYLSSLSSAAWLEPFWLWLIPVCFIAITILVVTKRIALFQGILRFFVLALTLLALASPALESSETSSRISALIDMSHSVDKQGRESFKELLQGVWDNNSNLELDLYPFGRDFSSSPLILGSSDDLEEISSINDSIVDSGGTDLALALSKVSSLSKSSSVLLLSDGQETQGNSKKAANLLKAKGLSLYPLIPKEDAFTSQRLSLSSLDSPITAYSGENIEIRSAVKNSYKENKNVLLETYIGENKISDSKLQIPSAEERVSSSKSPELKGGLQRVRVVLKESGKVVDELHLWISVKERSRTLLLSGTKADETVIKEVFSLQGASLESIITNGRKKIPTDFSKHSTIILNNVSNKQLPKNFTSAVEKFVNSGGGLLLIGGDRSFGLGGYIGTPLERISPVSFTPPRTRKKRLINAVALVLDKSGSMKKQGKIQSAQRAAISSINSLKDDDLVTVIGFDHTPFVVISLKKVAKVKPTAPRRLENLTAVGGTELVPALAAARRSLSDSGAGRKHIIVLSDGKFPAASGVMGEISRLRQNGISISTVALGTEADIPFMQTMASQGKGAFYQTNDASRLPNIFLKDIKVSVGEETMQEQEDFVVKEGRAGVTSVRPNRFPILRGFVETKIKPRAKLELETKKNTKNFPILASWNLGKGKVSVYTSDANGRWSSPWLRWNGFADFWKQLLDSINPKSGEKAEDVEYDLRYSVEGSKLVLDLALFDPALANSTPPEISVEVKEPGGESSKIAMLPIKKGRFRGEINDARAGDYRLNISYGNLKLPAAGVTIKGDAFGEKRGNGINYSLLSSLATLGGGEVNPNLGKLSVAKRTSESQQLLFIPLIVGAFFLLLIEIFSREFSLFSAFSLLKRKTDNN